MALSFYEIIAYFLIYSFLGWCAEVAFAALNHGTIVNRGFLNGPVCPIYGVGMLGVLLLAGPVSDRLPLLFLVGVVFCSLIELIGGWVLEKVFHTRWWDYSDDPFNLGGYICLGFSILWGLAVVFVVRLVHPAIALAVRLVPHLLGVILLIVFSVLFLADLTLTLIALIGLRRRMGELEKVGEALHAIGDSLSDRVGNSAIAADQKLSPLVESGKEKLESGKERLDAAKEASRERIEAAKEDSRERIEAARESSRERIEAAKEDSRERIEAVRENIEVAREALEDARARNREKLETRMQELRSIGPIAHFSVRRWGKAYPALHRELKERLDQLTRRH